MIRSPLIGSTIAMGIGLAMTPGSGWAQVEVIPIRESGPSENRVNIVILGDGFTASEQDALHQAATDLSDDLLTLSPWLQYAEFFNITVGQVVSAESGADHPSQDLWRDTALGAAYDCYDIARLICIDLGQALRLAAEVEPAFDLVVVVVNDFAYGGSGGEVTVVSRDPDAAEILRHELAHSFGGLADEYEDPFPAFPNCDPNADCPEPNVTLFTERPVLKWNVWVEADTALPTPETPETLDLVGAFEGARYQPTGVYRPVQERCLMRRLREPYCPVCTEALILAGYHRVLPIDGARPNLAQVTLTRFQEEVFSVDPVLSEHPSVTVSWWLDDGPVDGTQGPTWTLVGGDLGTGTHVIMARVTDATGSVRSDPGNLLVAEMRWEVTVEEGPPPACGNGVREVGEACDLGAANTGAYNGCESDCSLGPRCGDGALNGPETCDDGAANADGYGTCQADCTLGPYCGDGTQDPEEICDRVLAENCDDDCQGITQAEPESGCGCAGPRGAPAVWVLSIFLAVVSRSRRPGQGGQTGSDRP